MHLTNKALLSDTPVSTEWRGGGGEGRVGGSALFYENNGYVCWKFVLIPKGEPTGCGLGLFDPLKVSILQHSMLALMNVGFLSLTP